MSYTLPKGHYWISGYKDQYSVVYDSLGNSTNIVYSWNYPGSRGSPTAMPVISGKDTVRLYNRNAAWYDDRYSTQKISTIVAQTKKSRQFIIDYNCQREWAVVETGTWTHDSVVSYEVDETDANKKAESLGSTAYVMKIKRKIVITKPEVIVM